LGLTDARKERVRRRAARRVGGGLQHRQVHGGTARAVRQEHRWCSRRTRARDRRAARCVSAHPRRCGAGGLQRLGRWEGRDVHGRLIHGWPPAAVTRSIRRRRCRLTRESESPRIDQARGMDEDRLAYLLQSGAE